MLLGGRGQLSGPKQAIKIGDYVNEEVVSTRCLGVQIDNALKMGSSCIETNEVVYSEAELT